MPSNKHDATANAGLYATDAVMVSPDGVFNGRDNIEHKYTTLFLGADYTDHVNTLDQIHTASLVYPWAVSNWVMTTPFVQWRRFASVASNPDLSKVGRAG
jgi:hypothetical protein